MTSSYRTSALSTAAYNAGASSLSSSSSSSSSSSVAAVRLFSLTKMPSSSSSPRSFFRHEQQSPTSKVVHLVRHAEGTHNMGESESKLPMHFDAPLTPGGVGQCRALAERTISLDVDAVLVSPMTRCLETARLSFPHLYYHPDDDDGGRRPNGDRRIGGGGGDGAVEATAVPFVAHEEWRETVNFLCDSRQTKSSLRGLYPRVSFDDLVSECDPMWTRYEGIFGPHDAHTSRRESDDPTSLLGRARSAWGALLDRPERNLALVGHSAFFMHMFTPLHRELEGVVVYEDEGVEELMTKSMFDNCELRSVLVDVPR